MMLIVTNCCVRSRPVPRLSACAHAHATRRVDAASLWLHGQLFM